MFPRDFLATGEHTSETGQTIGYNRTAVIASQPRQAVDMVHVELAQYGTESLEINPLSVASLASLIATCIYDKLHKCPPLPVG